MTAVTSQGTKVKIWNGVAPVAPAAITAVSKASPAVVTVDDATGIVVGDIVVPSNTGFKTIDDMPFRVSAVAALLVTLQDSDTVEEIGVAAAGELAVHVMAELCVANFNIGQPAGSTLDVTTMCDVSRKTLTGLPGLGNWTANGYWDGSDAAQEIARKAYRSGLPQVFELAFKDGSGVAFRGALNQFDIGSAVDAPVTIALGGTVSGFVNRVTTP